MSALTPEIVQIDRETIDKFGKGEFVVDRTKALGAYGIYFRPADVEQPLSKIASVLGPNGPTLADIEKRDAVAALIARIPHYVSEVEKLRIDVRNLAGISASKLALLSDESARSMTSRLRKMLQSLADEAENLLDTDRHTLSEQQIYEIREVLKS